MAMITIPYAIADFVEMRERGFYYVNTAEMRQRCWKKHWPMLVPMNCLKYIC